MPQATDLGGDMGGDMDGDLNSDMGGDMGGDSNRNSARTHITTFRGEGHVLKDSGGNTSRKSASAERWFERFFDRLTAGDRVACRDILREYLESGHETLHALRNLIWPSCALIETLSRRDQISAVHEHCATVLLTQLVQRLECALPKSPARCRCVVVTSGRAPVEELAAEIFAGLAEADGFDVVFLGGGVESDDLFAEVGARQPSFVVSFAGCGSDAPRLRRFIDATRAQTPVIGLRIGVGGGVFTRAPGLAEEIRADFTADTPFEMLQSLRAAVNAPAARVVGRNRAA